MRRFVVIFLLFLLPVQVLAESLTDLSHDAHCYSFDIADTSALNANAAPTSTEASLVITDPSTPQQMEHADIHDSLHSASKYSCQAFDFFPCFTYRFSNHPLSYPPLRKPPRL